MTVAALPAPTQFATQAPYATAVAYATPSPYPTPVAKATATLYPTYTPYPTFTPTPTEMPATDTQAAALATVAAPPPTAVNTSAITKQEMLRLMETTQFHLGEMTGVIDHATLNLVEVDCQVIVGKYNSLVDLPAIVVPEGNVSLRDAYNAWQDAVNLVVSLNVLIEDCAGKIAADGGGSIPANVWSFFRTQLSRAESNLDNARRQLMASSD